jgi:hypothetical protein
LRFLKGFRICLLKAFWQLSFKLLKAFKFIFRDLKQLFISFEFIDLFAASACSFDIQQNFQFQVSELESHLLIYLLFKFGNLAQSLQFEPRFRVFMDFLTFEIFCIPIGN